MDINFAIEQGYTKARIVEWKGKKSIGSEVSKNGKLLEASLSTLCNDLVTDLKLADHYGNAQTFTAPVSCQTIYNNQAAYAQAPSYVTVTTAATVAAESCGISAITSPTTMSVSACFALSAPVLYTMKNDSKSLNYFIRCMQSNLPALCRCFSDTQMMHLRKIPRILPYLSNVNNDSDRRMKQHQQTKTSTESREFWRDLDNNSLLPLQFSEDPSNVSKNRKEIEKIKDKDDSSKTIKVIMSDHKNMKDDSSNSGNLLRTAMLQKRKVKLNNSVVTQADRNKIDRLSTIPDIVRALEYLKKIAIHNQCQQYSGTNFAITKTKSKLTDAHIGDSRHKILLQSVDKRLSPITIFPLVESSCGSNKVVNSGISRNLSNINTYNVSTAIANKETKISLASFSMYTQTYVALHNTSTIYQPMLDDLSIDHTTAFLNEEILPTCPETIIDKEVNKTVSIQTVALTNITPKKSTQTIKIILALSNRLPAKLNLASSNSGSKEVTEATESQITLHSIPTIQEAVKPNNSKQTVNDNSVFMESVIKEISNKFDEIKTETPAESEIVQNKRETVQNKNRLHRTTPSKPLSKIKSFFMSHQTNQINQNQSKRSIMSGIKNITSSLFQNNEPDLKKEQRDKEKEESIYVKEYDKIYNDSREKAYEKAYNDAYKSVVGTLYDDAYKRAYIDAYESARKEASFDAYSDTYDDVFSDAYEKVYRIACDEAYSNAVKDAREKAYNDVLSYCAKKPKK